jgi:DNA-binding transcriptional LysR family regulator
MKRSRERQYPCHRRSLTGAQSNTELVAPHTGSNSDRNSGIVRKRCQIRFYDADSGRIRTQEICRKAGFTPRFGAAALNIDNLTSMVAAGEGFALIPKIVLRGPTPGCADLPIAETNLCFELLAGEYPTKAYEK